MEHSRTIPGFPDYSIFDDGRVYNNLTGREVLTSPNNSNVLRVSLTAPDGSRTNRAVALLVARAFLPGPVEPEDTPIHKDGNHRNARADNLAWRPRWYAIMYHRQFGRDLPTRIHGTLLNKDTRETFSSSLEASVYYGVLEKDIISNVYGARAAVPVIWQSFVLLEDAPGLS